MTLREVFERISRLDPGLEFESVGSYQHFDANVRDWFELGNPSGLIRFNSNNLRLYSAGEFKAMQTGYSVGLHGQPLNEWPEQAVVIGDIGADPICVHSAAHFSVSLARHGERDWRLQPFSSDLLSFALFLEKWLKLLPQIPLDPLDENGDVSDLYLAPVERAFPDAQGLVNRKTLWEFFL